MNFLRIFRKKRVADPHDEFSFMVATPTTVGCCFTLPLPNGWAILTGNPLDHLAKCQPIGIHGARQWKTFLFKDLFVTPV
jgi:hypothetical protein